MTETGNWLNTSKLFVPENIHKQRARNIMISSGSIEVGPFILLWNNFVSVDEDEDVCMR